MGLMISELATGDRQRFHALLHIYQESIEPSEQKPPEAIAKLLENDTHKFLVATKEETVVGFAMLFFPSGVECWLLDYMATQSTIRSSGVGAALFAAATDAAQQWRGSSVGLMEIDKPLVGTPNFGTSLRRQSFYAKCGCRRIAGLDYLLPQVGVGSPPPMQLVLYQTAPSASIGKAVLGSWLSALYSQLYSCSAEDPRITRMLSSLPSAIELEEIV